MPKTEVNARTVATRRLYPERRSECSKAYKAIAMRHENFFFHLEMM